MNFIDHSESCLVYQNHELFQDFVHCIIEYKERAKLLEDNTEPNDLHVCEMFFRHVPEVHT